MERKGIIVSGAALIDRIKKIHHYPAEGSLVDIRQTTFSPGGALCNVLLDLSRLDPSIPLRAVGVLGKDELGDRTYAALMKAENADLSGIRRRGSASYTDVYESEATHQRTFFHHRGANSLLDVGDFDFAGCSSRIFYIGYLLLLDTLDEPEPEYGTRMAKLLCRARQAGLETCIDVVSLETDRFARVCVPALRYTTYCVINEIEAQRITGIVLRDENECLLEGGVRPALEKLIDFGVSKWAIIHTPEASFGMDTQKQLHREQGVKLPAGYIQGTVGAGDAFCAGVLCVTHQDGLLPDALHAGNASACAALRMPGAAEGILQLSQALLLYAQLHAGQYDFANQETQSGSARWIP